jgi:hypothetical protein
VAFSNFTSRDVVACLILKNKLKRIIDMKKDRKREEERFEEERLQLEADEEKAN